jgi:CBS domain containing-hemolysin-like protein
MNELTTPGISWLAVAGAVVFLLVDLVLSAVLIAVRGLSRVTLHRVAGGHEGKLAFAEELDSPSSSYRIATVLGRQLSLVAACVLAGTAVALGGGSGVAAAGAAAATLVGALLLQVVAARVVGLRHPRGSLRLGAPLVRLIHAVVSPLVAPVARLSERVRRDLSNGEPEGTDDQEAEAEAFIEVAEQEGILEESEGRMVRGIVDLGETRVREIMTPRTDILALPAEVPVREALRLLRRSNHTRLPVYRDTIDEVVGILHVRDLVRAWEEKRDSDPITNYVRPAFFVPEVLSVADLLAEMRTRTHIALAVDEYGGIAGLVTLEDVLEEIVGDIRDEHDLEEALVLKQPDGSWLVSGSAHVEQLNAFFDIELEGQREFDTVGGLVVSTLGRVPDEGETLEIHGLGIEVVKADPRRVYRVRIRRLPDPRDSTVGSEA